MAVVVWFVREYEGRRGPVEVEDDLAEKLIKKGDALALGPDLYARHYDWERAEEARIRKAAEGEAESVEESTEPNEIEGEAPPKRRGRPPKNRDDNGDAD